MTCSASGAASDSRSGDARSAPDRDSLAAAPGAQGAELGERLRRGADVRWPDRLGNLGEEPAPNSPMVWLGTRARRRVRVGPVLPRCTARLLELLGDPITEEAARVPG